MAGQLVGGGGQGGVTRQLSVTGGVHRRLPVLDSHPHSEGLLFHSKTRVVQHLKGIPGAVTQRQNDLPGGEGVKLSPLPDGDGCNGTVLYRQSLQPCAEADVRAQRQ